ncbi:hypothetical protein Tco_0431092 [Tanacetum coccineum]
MQNSKKGFILMEVKHDLSNEMCASSDEEKAYMKKVPYCLAVGLSSMQVRCTRPDEAIAQNLVQSKFKQNPRKLSGVLLSLSYSKVSEEYERYVFSCQRVYVLCVNGGAVDWKSKKQTTIVMHATQSEYMAASEAAMEAVWIRKFVGDLGVMPSINKPINMYCDNLLQSHSPMNLVIIRLPALVLEDGDYESIHQCCLSAPPDDPSSILLLTTTNKSIFLFCPIDSEWEDFRWAEVSYAQQLKRLTSNGKILRSLTCCGGKVFALSTDGTIARVVIHLDIVVKYNEVVINLMIFSVCPFDPYHCGGDIEYLKGSSTELFYIEIDFDEETNNTEKKPAHVYFFKTDTTLINWEERECFKDWDLSDIPVCDDPEDLSVHWDMISEILEKNDSKKLNMTCEVWKVN